ncbi:MULTISPECIES: hypothetical protein [unclassified Streptomyces]|nr:MULTISPECIES: hypothetical protein [unclassified Streptomyces]
MSHKKGADNAAKPCGNKYESISTPDAERTGYGWIPEWVDRG